MLENLFRPMHLIVIVFLVLLIFGPRKLPELGKSLGEGLGSLKDALAGNMHRRAKLEGSADKDRAEETRK